jgi:hypothetical protein
MADHGEGNATRRQDRVVGVGLRTPFSSRADVESSLVRAQMFPALYAAGLSLLRRQLIKEVYTTQTCGSASSTDQVTTGRPEGGSRSGSDDPLSPTIHEA